MTQVNRVDAAVDTAASLVKLAYRGCESATYAYRDAFFSEEANKRYEAAGAYLGDGIINTIERFELEEPVRNLYNRFRSDSNDEETDEMVEIED
jgi:hypothetical protein